MTKLFIIWKMLAKEMILPLAIALGSVTLVLFGLLPIFGVSMNDVLTTYKYSLAQVAMVFPIVVIFDFAAAKAPMLVSIQYERRFIARLMLIMNLTMSAFSTLLFLIGNFQNAQGLREIWQPLYNLTVFFAVYFLVQYICVIIYTFFHRHNIIGFILIAAIVLTAAILYPLYQVLPYTVLHFTIITGLGCIILSGTLYKLGLYLPLNR